MVKRSLCCIEIKTVDIRDLREIYEIELMSFPCEAYPFKLFLFYYILSKDLFIVAKCINRVIGYVIAVIEYKYGMKLGHIISIAVHPLYRRIGVGTELMRAVEERLRKQGIKKIYLEVRVSNRPAINLYKKLGYRIERVIPRYYGDEDAYLMVKTLDDDLS